MLDAIQKARRVIPCNYNDWNNSTIMDKLFEKYLKRKIAIADIEWKNLFTKWLEQKSGIIEIFSMLRAIYPENYNFVEYEIQA
jgi:hypothetical protein